MEPISLALEITSLSMQLVAMVKAIKGLVTSYKSAAQVLEDAEPLLNAPPCR